MALPSLLTTRYSQPGKTHSSWAVTLVLGVVLLAGCGSTATHPDGETTTAPIDPEVRAVRIETTACDSPLGGFGSGVVMSDGLVVTVAHLVIQADAVEVSVPEGDPEEAVLAAVDLERDLAALRLPGGSDLPDVETATADAGASGRVVGGSASGTVPFEVKRRVTLTIEEVLGTERHARLGYEVAAMTTDGDSGAGAYDEEDRLIGIVFAAGRDGETSWLTASSEIDHFLAIVDPSDTYPVCS
jgi:S1-C subfamily serine protease